MPLPFEAVREQPLRAGVAPRNATRYVTELREHLADLVDRERESGLDAEEAADRALALMGTDADLVRAMIAKGVPRSLAAVVYLHGRANLAATAGSWALHAGVLFAIAATAYHALRVRLVSLQG